MAEWPYLNNNRRLRGFVWELRRQAGGQAGGLPGRELRFTHLRGGTRTRPPRENERRLKLQKIKNLFQLTALFFFSPYEIIPIEITVRCSYSFYYSVEELSLSWYTMCTLGIRIRAKKKGVAA